ncbi:MAG: hypothetical protein JSS30_02955 [Verrucomicrobia bacterium]|nr:hypothetical protein [Verrucomicrobiota bacterium]
MHRFQPMSEGLSFEQIDIFFRINQHEGNEPHVCEKLAFFPLNDLPKTVDEFIRVALDNIQRGVYYSEFGFNGRIS